MINERPLIECLLYIKPNLSLPSDVSDPRSKVVSIMSWIDLEPDLGETLVRSDPLSVRGIWDDDDSAVFLSTEDLTVVPTLFDLENSRLVSERSSLRRELQMLSTKASFFADSSFVSDLITTFTDSSTTLIDFSSDSFSSSRLWDSTIWGGGCCFAETVVLMTSFFSEVWLDDVDDEVKSSE